VSVVAEPFRGHSHVFLGLPPLLVDPAQVAQKLPG
jgi:hypothetical protein